jgi:hypothetical protein
MCILENTEAVADPEADQKRERERERAVFRPSIKHISIHKCNKSLYIFTRCIAVLVYLITFELLQQSTINQKTK